MSVDFEEMRTYSRPIRNLPLFAVWAAEDILENIQAIQGEAMNDAQVEQDDRAGRDTFVRLVGNIIAHHYRGT